MDWQETADFVFEYLPIRGKIRFTSFVSLDNFDSVLGDIDNYEELSSAFANLMRPEIFNSNKDFGFYKDANGYVPLSVVAQNQNLLKFSENEIYDFSSMSELIDRKFNSYGVVVRPRGRVAVFLDGSKDINSYFNECTQKLVTGVEKVKGGFNVSFASQDSAQIALEYISQICNEPSHTPIADKLLTPEYIRQSASDFYQIIQTARSKPAAKIGADLYVIRPDGYEMVYRNNSSVYLKKRKARDRHT